MYIIGFFIAFRDVKLISLLQWSYTISHEVADTRESLVETSWNLVLEFCIL